MAVWWVGGGCVNEVAAVVVTYSFTCRVPFLDSSMTDEQHHRGKHCSSIVESLGRLAVKASVQTD